MRNKLQKAMINLTTPLNEATQQQNSSIAAPVQQQSYEQTSELLFT